MTSQLFQRVPECTNDHCEVGPAVLQLAGKLVSIEAEQVRQHQDTRDLFDRLDALRNWIMGTLAAVLLMGGAAILAFVFRGQ